MQFADVAWRGKAAKANGTGLEGLSSSGKVIFFLFLVGAGGVVPVFGF